MLKTVDHNKPKYRQLYIDMADTAAKQSVAKRRKVGAVVVLKSGLISIGFNGTPPSFSNACEHVEGSNKGKTIPEVIHAERNALDKLTRQGVSTEGAIVYVTTAPCLECAKSLASVGIAEVYYRDIQSNIEGIEFLNRANIPVSNYD